MAKELSFLANNGWSKLFHNQTDIPDEKSDYLSLIKREDAISQRSMSCPMPVANFQN